MSVRHPALQFHWLLTCCWLLGTLAGCEQTPRVSTGFYHWKGRFAPDSLETRMLCEHPVLYLRFFDLHARTGEPPVPVGVTASYSPAPCATEVIPVIFITQPALRALDMREVDTLAARLCHKVQQMAGRWNIPFRQIQLDSDWTPVTRDRYFRLIRQVKARSGCRVSVTLRLHQTKDIASNGIPPADRALLMAYNLEDVRTQSRNNSILHLPTLRHYLGYLSAYPLPLDVALPIFGWGAHYRTGKLLGLMPDMENPPDNLFTEAEKNTWIVQKSGYFSGRYWYAGDMLKLEYPEAATIREAADAIREHLPPSDSLSLLLYHLHSPNLHRYAPISAIFDRFR
ncbi:MAG: hypothetical protein KF690_07620 [Bacteroidetes bacterium]|nr:hypothetical protein [Bacteroidota bacterium]